jgi:sec-independent protein translocase protein TatA
MGTFSVWHWLIFLAIALLAFGGSGKISSIMGDFAKGIKSFKKGLADDEEVAKKPDAETGPPKAIEGAKATEVTGTPGTKVG